MDMLRRNRKIHGRFGKISNRRSMADTGRSNMECSGKKLGDLWEMRSDTGKMGRFGKGTRRSREIRGRYKGVWEISNGRFQKTTRRSGKIQ
jgi:hypothetical protein